MKLHWVLSNRHREPSLLKSILSIQDLHQFLPHLLANIFGFDQTPGWGLRYLHSAHPEFDLIYSFLNPEGDIFNLLMKLYDKSFSYEFPSACLPVCGDNAVSTHDLHSSVAFH